MKQEADHRFNGGKKKTTNKSKDKYEVPGKDMFCYIKKKKKTVFQYETL